VIDELLPAAEAARLVQPHLPGRDAAAWLRDLRRSEPSYAPRVRPPQFERRGNKVFYRRGEIADLIARLGTAAHAEPHRPATAKKAPILGYEPAPVVTGSYINEHGAAIVDLLAWPRDWIAIAPDDARRLAAELFKAAREAKRLEKATAA
jgi:hypothetical protein